MYEYQRKTCIILYQASQTYTATVSEHLCSFKMCANFSCYFVDNESLTNRNLDLNNVDMLIVHYSVRLPYGQLSQCVQENLANFKGLKVLFIQDEYDNTNASKNVMKAVKFDIVFTVVPDRSIEVFYPKYEFPCTKFVNNLTGYVPDHQSEVIGDLSPPSERELIVGYRARNLPLRYGKLGQEKIQIGKRVAEFCKLNNIAHDIRLNDNDRIYGTDWYKFLASSRAMLGTESGSNIIDWNGDLDDRIKILKTETGMSDADIYSNLLAHEEIGNLVNQISPKIFEMISLKTVMILLEGNYSGILQPFKHYLPLKKDYSNLEEIFEFLDDEQKVNDIAELAYNDIIKSGLYSYSSFIRFFEATILQFFQEKHKAVDVIIKEDGFLDCELITDTPKIADISVLQKKDVSIFTLIKNLLLQKVVYPIWSCMPEKVKTLTRGFLSHIR